MEEDWVGAMSGFVPSNQLVLCDGEMREQLKYVSKTSCIESCRLGQATVTSSLQPSYKQIGVLE